MVIIDQKGGNYWIEAFDTPRATVTAGNERAATLTFERPGFVVGVSICPDADTDEIAGGRVFTGGGALILNTFQLNVISRIRNNSSSSQEVGFKTMVWLRKRGRR